MQDLNFSSTILVVSATANITNGTLFGWSENTWGFIMAFVAFLMFGSFSINYKIGAIRTIDPDPMVLQIFINISVCLTSLIVLSYVPWEWSWWGILSGGLWMITNLTAIVAIKHVGISVAQGVWSGSTIIFSFIWGAAIFGEQTKSLGLSLLAIAVLFLGIAGISVAGSNLLVPKKEEGMYQPLSPEDEKIEAKGEERLTLKQIAIGIGCAIALGIPNASVYAPVKFPAAGIKSELGYIVPFGIGLLIVTPVFAVPYFLIFKKNPINELHWKILPLRAILAGFMWNIGNWASLYAIKYQGFTVGFPLTQCALLLGGFWGIVLFKEITGWKRIGLFALSCVVLIVGAILLGLYGKADSTPPFTPIEPTPTPTPTPTTP